MTRAGVGLGLVCMLAGAGAMTLLAQSTPALPSQAGVPAAPGQPVQLKPGPTMVVGRVVEAGSTSGVSGAIVTLSGVALGSTDARFTNGIPGGTRRAAADAQGRFVFRELPAGAYTLTSTASGYLDGSYGETHLIQIRRSLDLVRSLEVADADRLLTIEIPMWRKGGIAGRVIDEAGEPVVGVPVTILARTTDWSGLLMQITTSVTTDDRGAYHADVTPGDYIVGVLAATTTFPATEGPGGIVGLRLGNLFVTQVESRNVGQSAPAPRMFMQNGTLMQYPSTYHPASPTPMSAVRVTVASGDEKTGIDLHLRPIPVRRLSGRVMSQSAPVAQLALSLVPPDPSVGRTSPATLIDTPTAVADANGDFSFVGVVPGTYTVAVYSSRAPDTAVWAFETVTVSNDADLTDVQIVLKPGARIEGRVVFEGTPPAAQTLQQRPISITARAVPGSLGALAGSVRPAIATTPQFRTSELVPGQYMMIVGVLPAGWVVKSVSLAGQNVIDKAFELPAGGVTDMIVTLTDQISTVTGIARDEKWQPAPKSTVGVFPADRSLWRLPGMGSRRVQTAAPGRDGRYTFRGLPAGDYILAAVDWPAVDFSDATVLTALMATGARVTITGGESHTQDLRVLVKR